jgi:hypothetical protein
MLDDGSITIDCPIDKIPEKGYFTMFDGSQAAKGTLHVQLVTCPACMSCMLQPMHFNVKMDSNGQRVCIRQKVSTQNIAFRYFAHLRYMQCVRSCMHISWLL